MKKLYKTMYMSIQITKLLIPQINNLKDILNTSKSTSYVRSPIRIFNSFNQVLFTIFTNNKINEFYELNNLELYNSLIELLEQEINNLYMRYRLDSIYIKTNSEDELVQLIKLLGTIGCEPENAPSYTPRARAKRALRYEDPSTKAFVSFTNDAYYYIKVARYNAFFENMPASGCLSIEEFKQLLEV